MKNTKGGIGGKLRACGLLAAAAALTGAPAVAQFSFEDRTELSAIDYMGESYGSSWGDVNADGLPDIYVNHHREWPSVYLNNGDGSFTDIAGDVGIWQQKPFLDQHGAAWGDFNKDGYQDLFESLGAADNNQFLENFNGQLVDETATYNLEYWTWPGRLPMWLDANLDGQMDFTVMQRGKPFMFTQNAGVFTNITNSVGMQCNNTQHGHLADVNNDGRLDLICAEQTSWPDKVYDLSTVPYTNISSMLPSVGAVTDSVVGDFDGDLRPDFLVLRGTLRPSDAAIVNSTQVQAHLVTDGGRREYITFKSAGIISVSLDWNARNRTHMYIGANGVNPTGFGGNDPIEFTLDPANPDTWGLKPSNPASAADTGLYMGYDPATQTWTFSTVPGGSWAYTWWTLNSTQTVSDLQLFGTGGAEDGLPPSLLISGPSGYTNQAAARGLGASINCVSAVSADFDNDMDEDIYIVCRDGVTNLANRLYENDGSGNFTLVAGAGGAEGPVGYNKGRGESVTTADYDLNGFMDLYLTNGLNLYPEPPYSLGGRDTLIANLGNSNSWIELELVGTTSNGSAVGAKVFATAGGKTQLREQNGGYHRWSQNHQRLHFGLATNNTVDLRVEWPNGLVEEYPAVPANAIYEVTEGSGYTVLVPSSSQRAIGITDVTVNEGDGTARLTVSVSGSGDDVSVDYITQDGSAAEPGDYTATSGTLTFTSGVTEQFIDVAIMDDTDEEGSESFSVQLFNEVNGVLFNASGTVTINDNDVIACGEPAYSTGTELVVVLWQDCASGEWRLRSTGGGSFSNNIGSIVSSANLTSVTPYSIEGHDVFNTSDPKVIDFNLKAWNVSEDGFGFAVADGSNTCVTLANNSTVSSIQVGPDRVAVASPFDLASQGACETDPGPEPDVTLGQPTYDAGVDSGFYVWKDGSDVWHIRATAGGTQADWAGSLTATQSFTTLTPFSIEGHDTYVATPASPAQPDALNFLMRIWGLAEDGVDFSFDDTTNNVCLNLSTPGSATAIVGAGNVAVPVPFDLATLGACVP